MVATYIHVIISIKTHYNVSGGPIISTSHLYISSSSIRPAENPSTGFLFNSISKQIQTRGEKHWEYEIVQTFEIDKPGYY